MLREAFPQTQLFYSSVAKKEEGETWAGGGRSGSCFKVIFICV